MRIVFDTNVLISAFNFPGSVPEDAYRLCLDGRVELVTSNALLAEFGRILADKFGWAEDRAERAVAQVARLAIVVEPEEHVAIIAADPDDDRVLEAANEGGADVICSGDKHLLRLGLWQNIRILSPGSLVAEFESR
ncbi:MAG: putative toxin-antitoxin system toxin component, PIN family [Actinomycetota bacterium]